MPRATASGVSERIRLAAPRILKAPPRCRFSHLKKAWVPAAESKPAEVITGVLRARGRIRSAAARTSFASIARAIFLSLTGITGVAAGQSSLQKTSGLADMENEVVLARFWGWPRPHGTRVSQRSDEERARCIVRWLGCHVDGFGARPQQEYRSVRS